MNGMNFFEMTAKSILNTETAAWKNQGKQIIGIQCSGIPEEIIHAAGILHFGSAKYEKCGCPFTSHQLFLYQDNVGALNEWPVGIPQRVCSGQYLRPSS
jgi:hypothetical protein